MRCALSLCLCFASLLAACAPEGPSAYVSAVMKRDADCKTSTDATEFWANGLYDIAQGGDWDSTRKSRSCMQSYYMYLLINSNLKANSNDATGRAEPNVLQITEAEITLIDIEQQGAIPFDEDLPNPFRVKSNITLEPTTGREPSKGVVPIETIPSSYKTQLGDFIDTQIMAEVQLFGTTLGDTDIDFKPFSFPILICRGCRTFCTSDFKDGATKEDIYGDHCADDSAADDRICLDRFCPGDLE